METKPFKIYSKRIANLLCKRGFYVLGNVPNNNKPWLNVFLFENTDEFQKGLKEILDSDREERNAG